jgi:hypothetical protein
MLKTNLKKKVEILEQNLKIKNENDIIKKFKENNNREINKEEKENLLNNLETQKIFFDQFTIDEIEDLLKKTEEFLIEITNDIKKLKNNEIIDFNEFNKIFNKIKENFENFDSIYKIEEEFCNKDFINYLETLKNKFNSFINDFKTFEQKYQILNKIDSENILTKNFSLPEFQNKNYIFNLNEIKDKNEILSQPLIIKKNDKLFCNYKKIYFNSGPISPELFNNDSCYLKIYSLVNENLFVEFLNENKKEPNENFIYLNDKQYLKIKNNEIEKNSAIEIEFFFPPSNKTQKEKIYKLNKILKISSNSSSIEILIEIIFIICPIQIFFTCDNYNLIYENQQFKLNTNKLLKDEIINFKIYNNYENNNFVLKYLINSLEKNTNDEPEILIKNSNEINLIIKKNNIEEIDVLNCILEFYITENIKIPILIDALIIPTYFDFYIYDYETKNFVVDKLNIFIPNFEDQCEIELNFLVSTFENVNINGTFKINEISDGISFDKNEIKMNLNSNENYFSIKLNIDLTLFNDNEIAIFEFKINNEIKKIKLLEKNQKIENINLNLIKIIENENKIEINNINEINENSLLISPFTMWGKGIFLYRKCYINNQKDLELELNNDLNLFYLSEDGYLNKEKNNDYLIIIQTKEKWFSTIGIENQISRMEFEHILLANTENFYKDFNRFSLMNV